MIIINDIIIIIIIIITIVNKFIKYRYAFILFFSLPNIASSRNLTYSASMGHFGYANVMDDMN